VPVLIGEDIGTSPVPNPSGSYDDSTVGVHRVSGAGRDIWDATCSFYFVHGEEPIDDEQFSISAYVSSLTGTHSHAWQKGGMMIRDSLDPGSVYAYMCITSANGYAFQGRPTADSNAGLINQQTAGYTAPIWLKLERNMDVYTGYVSQDGVTWSQAGQSTLNITSPVEYGFAVTSHEQGQTTTAVFENYLFERIGGAPTGVLSEDSVNIHATANSTLALVTTGSASIGGLTLDPGVELEVTGSASLGLTNLSGGDGSTLIHPNVAVRGLLSPGGSDAIAAMTVDGVLELTDTARYLVEVGATSNDMVSSPNDFALSGYLILQAQSKLGGLPNGQAYGPKTITIMETTDEEASIWDCYLNYLDPTLGWVQDMMGGDPVVHPADHIGYGVLLDPTPDGNGNELAVYYDINFTEVDLFQAADGDANGDREVNASDIEAILAANKFGTGEPATWQEGDFTGDNEVGGSDIQAVLAANLFGQGPYAALDSGEPADAPVVDVLIDGSSVLIDTHGTVINSYMLTSGAGIFTGEDADNLGLFQEDTDETISGGMGFSLAGQHLLGDVIGDVDVLGDLAATYTVAGASGIYAANLIVVPEPGTLVLLATGALGLLLLAIRRRRKA